MRFIETIDGRRIAVQSVSAIDEFRPDKGHIYYTIHYHEGRDTAAVWPADMVELLQEIAQ